MCRGPLGERRGGSRPGAGSPDGEGLQRRLERAGPIGARSELTLITMPTANDGEDHSPRIMNTIVFNTAV
jgi:hypothetical protein